MHGRILADYDPLLSFANSFTSFKMKLKGYTSVAILLAVSQSVASESPRVSDCEEPVYALDRSNPRPELHLELGIMRYRECLLYVVDAGDSSEAQEAKFALQRVLLNQQSVWPLTDVIESAQTEGLWTDSNTAAALSIRNDLGTHVYVVLARPDRESLAVDITPIEYGLLGKLGTSDRSQYERFETEPVEWLDVTEDYFLLNVRLRAWRDGQRYTVFGPVRINADGTVIWQ